MNSAPPACPRCGQQMIRRIAKKGQKQGNEFWGCPKFPRCRGTITDSPNQPTSSQTKEQYQPDTTDQRPKQKEPLGLMGQVVKTIDKIQRWDLESNQPDGTGRWDKADRIKMLRYVHRRDGGRCGLCGCEIPLRGTQIEHIVPKIFGLFDLQRGQTAVVGDHYKSRLHKLDNLQAAHSYCNRRKGNSPDIRKWRHLTMPPLVVAIGKDESEIKLPRVND